MTGVFRLFLLYFQWHTFRLNYHQILSQQIIISLHHSNGHANQLASIASRLRGHSIGILHMREDILQEIAALQSISHLPPLSSAQLLSHRLQILCTKLSEMQPTHKT